MSKRKIVFLDFDGVLNNDEYFVQLKMELDEAQAKDRIILVESLEQALSFDPAAIRRLNNITDETGAVLVLTTAWISGWSVEKLAELLRVSGATGKVIGATPRDKARRNDQIKQWLEEHEGEVDKFVVLEDDQLLPDFRRQEVRPHWSTGLQDVHVTLAIEKLS